LACSRTVRVMSSLSLTTVLPLAWIFTVTTNYQAFLKST